MTARRGPAAADDGPNARIDLGARAERAFLRWIDAKPDERIVDLSFGDTGIALAVAGAGSRLVVLTDDETLRHALEARLRREGLARAEAAAAPGAGGLEPRAFDAAYLAVRPYLSNRRIAELIAGARRCLRPGGRLILIAAMRQGAPTVLRIAGEAFGVVEVLDKPGGTRIARCIAPAAPAEPGAPEPDPNESFTVRLFDRDFTFSTASGVFSRDGLDEGSRLLLETVRIDRYERIADVGCGYGAIGVIAAFRAPEGHAALVDASAQAVELARRNLAANGIANAEAWVSDGLSALPDRRFTLVLSNPPLHAGASTLERLTGQAYRQLVPGGRVAYVVHRAYDSRGIVSAVFGAAELLAENSEFRILGARRAIDHAGESRRDR